MEPGSVIEQFDVLEDGCTRCFSIGERTAIIENRVQSQINSSLGPLG